MVKDDSSQTRHIPLNHFVLTWEWGDFVGILTRGQIHRIVLNQGIIWFVRQVSVSFINMKVHQSAFPP